MKGMLMRCIKCDFDKVTRYAKCRLTGWHCLSRVGHTWEVKAVRVWLLWPACCRVVMLIWSADQAVPTTNTDVEFTTSSSTVWAPMALMLVNQLSWRSVVSFTTNASG